MGGGQYWQKIMDIARQLLYSFQAWVVFVVVVLVCLVGLGGGGFLQVGGGGESLLLPQQAVDIEGPAGVVPFLQARSLPPRMGGGSGCCCVMLRWHAMGWTSGAIEGVEVS